MTWNRDLSDRLLGSDRRQRLVGDFVPPHAEVLGNVGDGGSFEERAGVVPADARACHVVAGVVTIAGFGGEIDAADERHPIVDHDRLLVMTVHRPLAPIETALNLRAVDQTVAHRPHRTARGTEQRQRSTRPDEDANLHAFGKLSEQISKHLGRMPTHERKVRREIPARQMNMRPGLLELRSDPEKGFRSVDQNLHTVPFTGWRIASRPAAGRSIESELPLNPSQPPPVVAADRPSHTLRKQALRRKYDTSKRERSWNRGWSRLIRLRSSPDGESLGCHGEESAWRGGRRVLAPPTSCPYPWRTWRSASMSCCRGEVAWLV